jgi:PAS domain S-box-containing protein
VSSDSQLRFHSGLVALLGSVGYYLGGAIGIALHFAPGRNSGIWLPHGILVAALLFLPVRRWWWLAALLLPTHVHMVLSLMGPVPPATLAVQYGGNFAQAALAAAVVRPILGQPPRLNKLSRMTAFIVLAAVVVPALGCLVVTWLFTLTGWTGDFWVSWQRRVFSQICGAVVVTPPIIHLATGGVAEMWRAPLRRVVEFMLLTAGLGLVLLALFGFRPNPPHHLWTMFALLPLLLWSALRFGPGALGSHLLAVTFVALLSTKAGRGPFTGGSPAEVVLALQGFFLAISIPMLLLMALVQQHAQTLVALRESQARYRSVVEDQTELICRFLGDGTITFVNGAYCRYFRRDPADLVGQDFWQFIPAEQHAVSRAHLASITPTNPVGSVEHKVVAPGGEVRWQQWTDRGFFDPAGRILEYQSVGHDITERKRAEEAVKERENQLRLFVQHAPAAVAMFDREMRYLIYSQRWLTDYRLGDQNLTGRSHYDVFPEAPERWREIHRRCLAGAVESCEEDPFLRADGSMDWIRWEVRPWHNARHEIGGIIMFTEVITERKRAQDEHRQLLGEKQVAEALREVDRRKDEFLAMLAHELRNPLAPISMAVEILRSRAPVDESIVWAREVIDRQTAQLTRLVDDLLDVSRITLGKIRLEPTLLDLAGVVRQAVEGTRPLLLARNHQLTVELPPHPLPIRGDGVRLIQVVSNLLNNAAKYTGDGGRIALTVRQLGGRALLTVTDNGIGIPPEMLERVFDMFAQLESPDNRTQGGLGIGLALVKRLVEMHGGTIEARSCAPGSEFVVGLDLVADHATQSVRAIPASAREPGSARKRILIVDDNVDAAEALCRVLRLQEHEVQVAHDGLAGLDAARTMNPDVVLLDIGLPRLSGLEVARQLRQQTEGAPPLLVATTGFGRAEDRARTAAAGFDHHLTKPVDPQLLQSLVRSARVQ